MTSNGWVHRDRLRCSWVFLLLGGRNEGTLDCAEPNVQLEYWEYGVGNADQLVSTDAAQIGCGSIDTESGLVSELLSQLEEYRYEDTVVITRTVGELQAVRRSIVATDTEPASLRGLSCICLQSLLNEYFDQSLADYGLTQESLTAPRTTSDATVENTVTTGSAQEFWTVWQRLYQLIPARELTGEEL